MIDIQRLRISLDRILAGTGIILIAIAFINASFIPEQAEQDLRQRVQQEVAQTGRSAILPEESIFYRQIRAHSRMLQNSYLGATGIVLLAAGAFGMVLSRPK